MSAVLKVTGTYAVTVIMTMTVELDVKQEWDFDELPTGSDLDYWSKEAIEAAEDDAIADAKEYVEEMYFGDYDDIEFSARRWKNGPTVAAEEIPELTEAQKMALMGVKPLFDLDLAKGEAK